SPKRRLLKGACSTQTHVMMPKFELPPVIETVLGVEFEALERFGIAHFGLFWSRVRSVFPRCAIQPPLVSSIETFDQPITRPQLRLELADQPEVRCWFHHTDGQRLIQVQRDRFIHNWQKTGDSVYPSYERIKPGFETNWNLFRAFLQDETLGEPRVLQCEVTYINRIEMPSGQASPLDLPKIFPLWSGEFSDSFLPAPERAQLGASFLMPNNQGRLHVNVQPAVRISDLKEVLQLTLTARGAPSSSDTASVLQWFDLGHEWVVKGFVSFTSSEMHKAWGRVQ
ncbi:MAG TPA: TIGR04255 family protein, partial [Blastocatellia bacterium]|nr:TIGR04255 family protein [Blastocatellia bacterium]